jgi:hypothetical protein
LVAINGPKGDVMLHMPSRYPEINIHRLKNLDMLFNAVLQGGVIADARVMRAGEDLDTQRQALKKWYKKLCRTLCPTP